MGGEDLIVYTIDDEGTIVSTFAGNKCAAGTGEFFKQQLGRMNMTLDEVADVSPDCKAMKLSIHHGFTGLYHLPTASKT